MINKKGLWFLTLFSLVLVLGVYYTLMPDEMFEDKVITTNDDSDSKVSKDDSKVAEVNKENTSYIETLKVELDSKRATSIEALEEIINDSSKSVLDKNKAYEQMKTINDTKAKEDEIAKKIKTKFSLDAFVKQDDDAVEIVIDSKKHDVTLANQIMRCVQEEYKSYMQISVKFS